MRLVIWQAARSLAASDVLGHQVLLRPGLMPALVALMRPRHLAALADWHARVVPPAGADVASLPVLVTGILHEGILHAQPAALSNVHQVRVQSSSAPLWRLQTLQLQEGHGSLQVTMPQTPFIFPHLTVLRQWTTQSCKAVRERWVCQAGRGTGKGGGCNGGCAALPARPGCGCAPHLHVGPHHSPPRQAICCTVCGGRGRISHKPAQVVHLSTPLDVPYASCCGWCEIWMMELSFQPVFHVQVPAA